MKIMYRFIVLILMLGFSKTYAQPKTRNLVIVTLDGMRWQEVFAGIDSALLNDERYTRDRESLAKQFWAESETERREKLFPFLWGRLAKEGIVLGNRKFGNRVDNANPYWFSYPGYNEIFTGYPDSAVNSNDKIYNANENVLEFMNKQPGFHNRVAAFSTWDAFPYILNEPRSGIFVNADVDTLSFQNPQLQLLNDMQFLAPRPIGVRPDLITYFAAREYLKAYKPRILYIAFDETDDFAHAGLYDQYIGAAHAEDAMLGDLWRVLKSMPEYRQQTSLLITCDHGRGDRDKSTWRSHGREVAESHEIWLAAMGPDTPAEGEKKQAAQYYQKQIAATLAALLGYRFTANHPVAEPINGVLRR